MTGFLTSPRRFALPLLAAVVLAGGATVDVAAKKPRPPVRRAWEVTVSIEQTAAWNIPRYEPFRDCYHRYYYAETGSDSYKVATRRAARVETLVAGKFGQMFTDPKILDGFIPAGAMRKREVHVDQGWDAGDCGRASEGHAAPKLDCGTRLPGMAVALQWIGGQLKLTVVYDDRYVADNLDARFKSCPLRGPKGMFEESFPDAALKASLPLGLVKRWRPFKVTRTVSYPTRGTETQTFPGSELTTSGKLTWTAVVTPPPAAPPAG